MGRCCVLHREVGATLVRGLKYGRAEYLLRDLGQMAAHLPHVVAYAAGTTLVPVPLHPTRQRERGFNQSEELAKVWAEALPVAGWASLLARRDWTGSQTKLARQERLKNVRGAFVLQPDAKVSPDLTYVLVDDVFTTGSTINECCRVLRRAGARDLRVLTLAHG
jgi:ComF family protein